MAESTSTSDFQLPLEDLDVPFGLPLTERMKAQSKLSREEYARRGAEMKKLRVMQERAANEKIAMVYSPLASPEDLLAIIPQEEERCFKIALRYAKGDYDDAKEIYQLALISASQNLKGKEPYLVPRKAVKRIQAEDEQKIDLAARQITVRNPAAWLHTIVRNTGLNECVKKRRKTALLKKVKEEQERESRRFEQPEIVALRNISNAELRTYVRCLPDRFSKIISLHYFDGLSHEEIAKELGLLPSTVRVSAMRALRILKDVLQDKRDVEGGKIGRPKLSKRCSPSSPKEKAC